MGKASHKLGEVEPEADQKQTAYTVLNDIFSNVNEQLRFAETKNGALLTLNSAIALSVCSIIGDHGDKMAAAVMNWLLAVGLCCGAAAIICLISFLPEMSPRTRQPIVENPINVFFFGHIRAHSEPAYLRMLFEGMGLTIEPLTAHLQLANQIGTNSQNAHKKFSMFAIAASITLVGFVLPSAFLAVETLILRA